MTSPKRTIVLNTRTSCEPLLGTVAQCAAQADEVVLAIDEGASARPLHERWREARSLTARWPNVWTTILTRATSLLTRADRMAALPARLGAFDRLYADDPRQVAMARALGFAAERAARGVRQDRTAPAHAATCALVVLRAQPFHRGHRALVDRALALADEAIVLIAAAERSHSAHDPFTAGERMALVRAGLADVLPRIWLCALPAPTWPALSLPQLAWLAPRYQVVVTNNPALRMLAEEQGLSVEGTALFELERAPLTATRVRARLARDGAGPWLYECLPDATAALLLARPLLARRCAVLAQ